MNQVLDNSVRRADPHLRFPKERRALVEEKYDAATDKIVQSWTPRFDTARAFKFYHQLPAKHPTSAEY
jgi:hypothetical protein